MLYRFVCIQYIYYHDFVCSWPALCLWYRRCHVWVRFIHARKIIFACMSSLILSIDIRRIYYFILFYFKLTNGAMEKWWMIIWCNGEINNITGRFLSHKFWIYLFVLFSNTTFLLMIKNKQTLIRYCKTSFSVVIFSNGNTEKLC